MTRTALCGWCWVVLLGFVVGCTQPTTERPPTSPVSGTVTLGGEPVEGAIVTFFPSAKGVNSAVGKTDASGKYTLTTWEQGDGAMPGEYNVKIVKFEAAAPDETEYEASEGSAYMPNPTDDAGTSSSVLPEKYSNPGTSELTATVAEGQNTFDFKLEQSPQG